MDVSGFTTCTPEQIAAAPQFEPSSEMTLRAADISEEEKTGFRVHKIKDAAIFAAMDTTAEELKDTVREAFGVDTAKYGLPHKVEWANIRNAWLAVKVNHEVKTRVDAVARAHGQHIQYLTADWASMLVQFKKKQYGLNIHEAKLPAQSYYESFEERLHNEVIEAGTLAHVVSLEEEREQMASKPEPPTQMGLHLDSTMTLQTKKRYISRMPTDPESLSTKYRVMSNLWLLAQLRQPGRQHYADLTRNTFKVFLEELLSTDNFLSKKQIEGETWAAPIWLTVWNMNSSTDVRP